MFEFNNPELKSRRKYLRNNCTDAELFLWLQLKNSKLGYKFKRQTSIGPYIVDFYCPSKKLVIELDGSQHNDDGGRKYDQFRTSFLKAIQIKVIRFWNYQVFKDTQSVLENIYEELAGTPA